MRRLSLALAALLTILAVCACGTPKPQRYGSGCGPILLAKHRYGCAPPPVTAPQNTTAPYFTASTVSSDTCTSGCAIQGQQLNVTTGVWSNSPTSYSYQWQDCAMTSAQPPTAGSCANATGTGATTATYTVGSGDVGKALAVKVTATNAGGSTSTTLSGACNQAEMSSNLSPGPLTQTAGCSPVSAVAATSNAGELYCTNALTTCGYGDPLNDSVGVPAGTSLTPYSGPSNITTAGTTINDAEITSPITISANNVTIENSDISINWANSSSEGAIHLASGVTGTQISYDTFHGTANTAAGQLFAAVYSTDYTAGANQVTIDHVNFYNGQRILHGPGTVQNSYCLDSIVNSGSHYECVYEGGGSSTIDHNVLSVYVPSDQGGMAGAIYLSTDFASEGTISIINNLLAGGNYTLYGGAPSGSYTIGSESDTGNRWSRAFWSTVGYYGPVAYLPSSYTWSGNVYDDTGGTVAP